MCGTTLGHNLWWAYEPTLLTPNIVTLPSHHLWWAYEPTLLTPNIVTLPSLEPTTSRIPVQRCTAKPKRTQARGQHWPLQCIPVYTGSLFTSFQSSVVRLSQNGLRLGGNTDHYNAFLFTQEVCLHHFLWKFAILVNQIYPKCTLLDWLFPRVNIY